MLIREFKICQSWEPEGGQFAFRDLFLHFFRDKKSSCLFLCLSQSHWCFKESHYWRVKAIPWKSFWITNPYVLGLSAVQKFSLSDCLTHSSIPFSYTLHSMGSIDGLKGKDLHSLMRISMLLVAQNILFWALQHFEGILSEKSCRLL